MLIQRRLTTMHWMVMLSLVLSLLLANASVQAATELVPRLDDEVLETMAAPTIRQQVPAATQAQTVDLALVMRQVHGEITLARQTGDTRYWGRAQALLMPWWDRAGAPPDLMVLQATIQQGRHEFGAARRLLDAVVAKAPGHAQAWLDIAALARLKGDYAGALQACDAVAQAGVALYAQACRLETVSLQGRHADAAQGLQRLIDTRADAAQRSWLLSLLAESLERAGRDAPALAAYRLSLAAQHDLYTTIAVSDLLLRTGKPGPALRLLEPLPSTDAVLLRQASALRQLGESRWTGVRDELRTRAAELRRRGDNVDLHGREAGLIALWLDDDPQQALRLAQRNLELQREPVDWWLALSSAQQSGDVAAWNRLQTQRQATGLRDHRLDIMRGPVGRAEPKAAS